MTLVGHAVLGAGLYTAVRPWGHQSMLGLPKGWGLWLAVLLSMISDLDVLGDFWGLPTDVFTHRGLLHAWPVAFLAAMALAIALQVTGRLNGGKRAFMLATAFFGVVLCSHGCVDALSDAERGPTLFWPLSDARVSAPVRLFPAQPAQVHLVRTEWTKKQRRRMQRVKTRIAGDDAWHNFLKRGMVSLSDDPIHAPRLAIVGVALTECLFLAPLFFIGWWRRRRFPPPPPPIEYKRLATITAWVVPRPSRTVGAVLASVSGVAFVVVLLFSRAPTFALDHSRLLLREAGNTPAFVVRPKAESVPEPYVLLVHDWRASHETLLPMARTLARNGIEVVNIDVAGHSANRTPFDRSCPDPVAQPCQAKTARVFTAHIESVLLALQDIRRFHQRPLVLIGHGAGGTAALQAQHPAIAARVSLDGVLDETRLPHNVLAYIRPGAKAGLSSRVKTRRRVGRFSRGDAYRIVINDGAPLFWVASEPVNRRILSWYRAATGAKLTPLTEERDPRPNLARPVLAVVFGLIFALCCLHFLLSMLTDLLPKVLDRRPNLARPRTALLCVLVGTIASVLHFGSLATSGPIWVWASTGLLVPPALGTFVLWGGVPYVVALLLKTRDDEEGRGLLWPRPVPVLAVVLAVMFYGLLVLGVADGAVYHAAVPVHRLSRWALMAALLFPFARVVQDVGPQALRFWPRAGRMALRCALWMAACWLLALGRATVETSTLQIAALAIVAEAFGAVVLRHTGSRFCAAVTVALVLGAGFAAFYPLVVNATA